MARTKIALPTTAAPVESYKHTGKRVRIPTQEESVKLSPRDKRPEKKKYAYDPSLDPRLEWAGKSEAGEEFNVTTVPIYVQEKISPEALFARLKAGSYDSSQTLLFGETAHEQMGKAIDFYKHEDNWQNRMVLGDSLLVMNSLLEKEGMRGKVQCVYIDPPYGIKFGSNWHVSTRKKEVKDNKFDDLIRQPDQIKSFRDTWELGIHSYLSYLRDRLIAARELLTESGSCFVQINDENVHLLRNLLDEVFGAENFGSMITYRTRSPLGTTGLAKACDYLIWYYRDAEKAKIRNLYIPKSIRDDEYFDSIELADGTRRRMTRDERNGLIPLPQDARVYSAQGLLSSGRTESCVFPYKYGGKEYMPGGNRSWRTHPSGMKRLDEKKRLIGLQTALRFVQYLDDFPFKEYSNIWYDTYGETDRVYAVQTNTEIIQRALLMSTDPGDIVVDPTCGSGTTAYVAEQWGRRWITIDTSRVALALARTRLMTAKFSYFRLKEEKNISAGFEYKTVPHVTLKSLANDEQPDQEVLYDQPIVNKDIVRVAGPMTVESLSPHRISDAQEMVSSERFVETVITNLRTAGVQTGQKGARVEFENLDILPSGPEVQAAGEYITTEGLKRVAVAVGPEFGSVDDDFIMSAIAVAKRFAKLLVVAATSFDASAFSVAEEQNGLRVMRVKINPDLSMGDLLKKTGSGNLFIAFGEPQVEVKEKKDGITVEVKGVDVYDPVKSEIRSSGDGDPEHDIAAWFIDTNYNGEAFFVCHAYFLGGNKPYEKLQKALKADIPEEVWDELYSTVSRPFPKPTTGKIAVKVINHYGDEVMKVISI